MCTYSFICYTYCCIFNVSFLTAVLLMSKCSYFFRFIFCVFFLPVYLSRGFSARAHSVPSSPTNPVITVHPLNPALFYFVTCQ